MPTSSKFLSAVCLIASVGVAHAVPIVFTTTTYTTFAQADAGDASDGPFSDSSPTPLPFSSSAQAISADGDSASAVALVDTFFLTATSDANALVGAAAASAVSTFSGAFDVLPGALSLSLGFESLIDQLVDGFASGSLSATLEVGGITLFDDILTAGTLIDTPFLLAVGGAGLLDLTLISTADAAPGSSAFNLSSVNFALDATPVPEPASAALVLAGLIGAGVLRRQRAI